MKIGKWFNGESKEPLVSAIQSDDIIVNDEWYHYYRKCSNNVKKILKILDSFPDQPQGYSLTDEFWDQLIEIRTLADIKDPEEMKEWLLHCKTIKKDVPMSESKRGKFASGIGAYKWQCIEKLKSLKVDESLCVEDRTHETVGYWIKYIKRFSSPEYLDYRRAMPEFSGKRFSINEINHNTQEIWRVK